MRTFVLILALTGTLFLGACTSVLSLNGAASDDNASFDTALLGVWGADGDSDTVIIRQPDAASKVYSITLLSKDRTEFEARLIRAGGAEVLDMTQKTDSPFLVPAHFFVRVWPEGTRLRFAYLDSESLRKKMAEAGLPTQSTGGATLLTAPSAAVYEFLAKNAADEAAHSDVDELTLQQ